jgi:hypothetical protein
MASMSASASFRPGTTSVVTSTWQPDACSISIVRQAALKSPPTQS